MSLSRPSSIGRRHWKIRKAVESPCLFGTLGRFCREWNLIERINSTVLAPGDVMQGVWPTASPGPRGSSAWGPPAAFSCPWAARRPQRLVPFCSCVCCCCPCCLKPTSLSQTWLSRVFANSRERSRGSTRRAAWRTRGTQSLAGGSGIAAGAGCPQTLHRRGPGSDSRRWSSEPEGQPAGLRRTSFLQPVGFPLWPASGSW